MGIALMASRPALLCLLLLQSLMMLVQGFSKPNTNWMYCPQSDDPDDFLLKVQSIVLDPETVERGKPFTFAITGQFGKEGGVTHGATVQVTMLYDLGKKVTDEYAGQMRLKGMDVEQLEKHTSLRILNH